MKSERQSGARLGWGLLAVLGLGLLLARVFPFRSSPGFLLAGVLLLPGCFLFPGAALGSLFGFAPCGLFPWLGRALALSLAWQVLAGTLLKLFGFVLAPLSLGILSLAPGVLLLLPVRRFPPLTADGLLLPWMLGMSCLVGGALATWHPFLVGEQILRSHEYGAIVARAEAARLAAPMPEIEIEPVAGWTSAAGGQLRPNGSRALLELRLKQAVPCRFPLLFFLAGTEEAGVEMVLNGKKSVFAHLPPPYDPGSHPRNFPAGEEALLFEAELLPGENLLEFNFRTPAGSPFVSPPRLTLSSASTLTGRALSREILGFRLLADLGDLREQIFLTRSLLTHPLPRAASYDGTFFDGGGFTLEHLPFPFLPRAAYLGLWDGGFAVFQLFTWGILALILLGFLHLAELSPGRGRFLAALLGAALLYLALNLVRYRLDTPYVGLWLAVPSLFLFSSLRREDLAFSLLWGLVLLLTKGGVVFLFLEMAVFQVVFRRGRFVLRLLLLLALAGGVSLFAVLLPVRLTASKAAWTEMTRGNYLQRFSGLWALFRGDELRGNLQLQAFLRYVSLLALGSAGTCFLWPWARGKTSRALILLSLGGALLVGFSRPSLLAPGYVGFRMSYLSPVLFFIPVPALRLLSRPRRWCAAAAVALGILLCLSPVRAAAERYEQAMNRGFARAMSRISLADFFLRRGLEGDRENLNRLLPGILAAGVPSAWPTYQRLAERLEAYGMLPEASAVREMTRELKGARR